MYFFSKKKKLVYQLKFVSQDQISDMQIEKRDIKDWQSIKYKNVSEMQMTFKND